MSYAIAAVNPTLANAAYAGALAGMLAAAVQVSSTASQYANATDVALAFATEVDAQFTADTTITTSGSPDTTIAPVAGVTTANLNFKGHLMFGLAFGYFFGRASAAAGSQTASSYSGAAAVVAAAYNEAVTTLGTPLV